MYRFSPFLVVLVLAACGGSGTTGSGANSGANNGANNPPAIASVARDVLPKTTDSAIDASLEAHFVVNPGSTLTNKQRLLVFLPGTLGTPASYRLIVREAATQGVHGIGLNYPNNATIASLCRTSTDVNCNGNARLETLTGSDVSSVTAVNVANSIENRLLKLLQYLNTQSPSEGWGDFLSNGQINWSRIRVAGHSQGGGHAAFIAKRYLVDRAVFFGAPADTLNATAQLVPWLSATSATPASRQGGFTHERDELASLAVVQSAWQAIGLTGAAQSVDAPAPVGFNASRRLTTNANPTAGNTALSPLHSTPIVDSVTPLALDGTAVFAPVWRYLCFTD